MDGISRGCDADDLVAVHFCLSNDNVIAGLKKEEEGEEGSPGEERRHHGVEEMKLLILFVSCQWS